jgi:ribonuclease T2
MNGRFKSLPALVAYGVVALFTLSVAYALDQSQGWQYPSKDKDVQRNSQPAQRDDGVRSNYDDRRNRGQQQPSYQRNTAGDFDYYALVLSWSPTHCSGHAGADDATQCNRMDGKRYSFIVHGLWPQYQRGYPENCTRTGSSYIPEQMIERMMDIMPSKKLIIHEYRKHGTCSGLAPFAYFEFIRSRFTEIKIPDRYTNPFESQFVSPSDLVDQFVEINPKLKPEMIAVACGGAGNRLKEIRICLTKSGEPTACGSNENPKRMCSATSMFVPPVRSSRAGDETSTIREKIKPQTPLPMPRVNPWAN